MKKFLLILFLFFMSCLNTQATTWVKVDNNEYIDKDSVEYYVNDYGQIDFNKKMFWYKQDNDKSEVFKDFEKDFKKNASYALVQYIIDINQKKIASKSFYFYDKEGNSVLSQMYKDFELDWNAIVPNSKADIWYELVKRPRYLKKIYKLQLTEQVQQENKNN